nr:LAGLIDADG endonuclease [Colacogloea effusa]
MFIGLVDGDGYIAVTKTHLRDYISISLVLALKDHDEPMLKYIQSTLKMGRISYYPATHTVKYIINRTDLQELLFPIMLHYNVSFLTLSRRTQFNLAMAILTKNIKNFSLLEDLTSIEDYLPLPTTAIDYLKLPYFLNWIVGFTIAEGSFFIKASGDMCFQLKQRREGHVLLFEAIKLVFNTSRQVSGQKYLQLSLSSVEDIEKVVIFFSFSNLHPLLGLKSEQYNKWIGLMRHTKRFSHLKWPATNK